MHGSMGETRKPEGFAWKAYCCARRPSGPSDLLRNPRWSSRQEKHYTFHLQSVARKRQPARRQAKPSGRMRLRASAISPHARGHLFYYSTHPSCGLSTTPPLSTQRPHKPIVTIRRRQLATQATWASEEAAPHLAAGIPRSTCMASSTQSPLTAQPAHSSSILARFHANSARSTGLG